MSFTLKLLLLLLLVLSHDHVVSGSIVKFLPGFEGPLPFELETGRTCSSLNGLLYENGPVSLKIDPYNEHFPFMVSTTYAWTKMANILYVDQPVGVGFSYRRTTTVDKTGDTIEVGRIHEFLQKWLGEHPKFFSNSFYVSGNSYAGKIVPALVQKISKENYVCCKPPINLQGYVLGDPVTDEPFDLSHRIPYAHGMALISDELFESLKRSCKGSYIIVDPRNTNCLKLIEEFHKCTDKIYDQHILYPICDDERSPLCSVYEEMLAINWANDNRVREALQIRKRSIGKWSRCTVSTDMDSYDKDITSSVPYHMNNSLSGYRSLIHSGDHDFVISFVATQAWIRSLNYPIIHDWRPWILNDQVAGYTRTYTNKMTFATVKGGGHTADFKPDETSIMFQRWISGQPL